MKYKMMLWPADEVTTLKPTFYKIKTLGITLGLLITLMFFALSKAAPSIETSVIIYATLFVYSIMWTMIVGLIKELERNSTIDFLTGIQNRSSFQAALSSSVSAMQRTKNTFSLIVLDIDYFKQYNDSAGHIAGDKCLKLVASILASQCKNPNNIVARVGGEEFAIILPNSEITAACLIANNIKSALKDTQIPHPNSCISAYVTVSAGVCEYQLNESEEDFYKRADTLMYQAKKTGRNKIIA